MTPAGIDAALKRIVSEAGAVAQDPLASEGRTLAAAISLLSVIVGEQEQRLRALEPCPENPGSERHAWTGPDKGRRCGYCGLRALR